MRENRIDWTRIFKPICLLCMVCGGLFGLLGKPRALVPLLDFLALAAALFALWKIGLCWQVIAGVVLSALYLVGCNANTAIGDEGSAEDQPDYSELHPYWENMEKIKREWENNSKEASGQAAEETDTSKTEN